MGGAAAMQGVQMAGRGTGAGLQGLAQNKHGGGYDSAYGAENMNQRLLGRGIRDLLREERRGVEAAISAGMFIQPEIYRALGFEPQYASRDAELGPLVSQRDLLQKQLADIESRFTAGQGKGKKPLRKGGTPKDDPRSKRANKLRKQIAVLDGQIADIQTSPGTLLGIKKIGPNDPTDSEGGAFRDAFDLQNQALGRALRGEEPLDPTLLRSLDEEEAKLREGLRRNMGSDFESSTPGIEALAEFRKRKAEALATYNREAIQTYSGLSENRAAALSNLTGQRIEQLSYPARAQQSLSAALGGVAQTGQRQDALEQEERRRIDAPFRDNRVMNAFGMALSEGFK